MLHGFRGSEEEAHDSWLANDLNKIATGVALSKGYKDQVFEDMVQELMIEGVAALRAWKKGDRKMPLNDYCRYRMKRRLPRMIAGVREDASANMVKRDQRELFYQLNSDDMLTESERIEMFVAAGYLEEEFHHLQKKVIYADTLNIGEE